MYCIFIFCKQGTYKWTSSSKDLSVEMFVEIVFLIQIFTISSILTENVMYMIRTSFY